jgi:hypothetical protein
MRIPPAPVAYLLNDPRPVLPREIVAAIMSEYGLTLADLNPSSHLQKFVHPRSACAFVLRQRGSPFRRIGRILGYRDHKAAMYAVRRFERRASNADWAIIRRHLRQDPPIRSTDFDHDMAVRESGRMLTGLVPLSPPALACIGEGASTCGTVLT